MNGVLVLAVDTSARVVTTAVCEIGANASVTVLAHRDVDAPNRHGELLAPLVDQVLEEAAVAAADLGAIAAGLGPGPFTGLRVGVVTAVTMADALQVPVYGACSLDALALRHDDGSPVVVCTDARRRQVYWARYDATGRRVEGPDLAPAADVAARLHETPVHVLGAGVGLYRATFDDFCVHDEPSYAAAGDVARLVADRAVAGAPSDVMEPLYLRRPDAVPPGAPKPVTAP